MLIILAVLLVTASGCSSSGDDGTTTTTTGASSSDGGGGGGAEAPGGPCADLHPIGQFGEVQVTIGEDPQCLLLAQTGQERERGLMEVTDFAGYPGMLFVFPSDVDGSFWMRNTPTPLSIAYVAEDGSIVSTIDMEPCDDVPTCPSYPAQGSYRFAVEVPQGHLDDIGLTGDARLTVDTEVSPS